MYVTRLCGLSLVVAVAVGCSSDATAPRLGGFTYSGAAGACGPANGPAVMIFLAPNPIVDIGLFDPPYVRVFVPVAASELTAHMWPIGTSTEAQAWFRPDASTSEIAGLGFLIVTSVSADNTINGSLDLQFSDTGRITTEFHAKWLPSNFYCI